MPSQIVASLALVETNPASTSFLKMSALGVLSSFSSVAALLSALLILVGTCYLVSTKQRSAVLAVYLILLPLPSFISFCGFMSGCIRSLSVISSFPELTPTSTDYAAAFANALSSGLSILLCSAPTYFVLAYGLLSQTLRYTTDPIVSDRIQSQKRKPQTNSGGAILVGT